MISLKVMGGFLMGHFLKFVPKTNFTSQENGHILKNRPQDTFFSSTLKVQASKMSIDFDFRPIFRDIII